MLKQTNIPSSCSEVQLDKR